MKQIKLFITAIAAIATLSSAVAQQVITDTKTIEIQKDECWWGGFNTDGTNMPYTQATNLERDQWGNNMENQIQPLFISNKGRYIWSEAPLKYEIKDGKITVGAYGAPIEVGESGKSLPEVFQYVSKKFFPSTGVIPEPLLFREPQYNTWIELTYNQNEQDILKYAQTLIDQGYPTGVLMIDDTWQEDYGDWRFSGRRFDDPKSMMQKLHDQGFKLMLWICPFVSADSENFRYLDKQDLLMRDPDRDRPATVRWWNGYSGLLDLSKSGANEWFLDRLHDLEREYNVDGFKFDAGDSHYYCEKSVLMNTPTPNDHTILFAELGLKYPLNEYRACWKMAGQPLVQRLCDKPHSWKSLQQLIPDIVAQGLMGYAYVCPDMIGGGAWTTFASGNIDEEIVVRSAQVHALMPMMQFSVAPWRVLTAENAKICADMANLHSQFGERIVEMAKESAVTGEPIVRHMAYNYPKSGYENITDQFMLGRDIIVAPVIESKSRSRVVYLPKGRWKGDDGKVVNGGKAITIDVPLERLPYYQRVK